MKFLFQVFICHILGEKNGTFISLPPPPPPTIDHNPYKWTEGFHAYVFIDLNNEYQATERV